MSFRDCYNYDSILRPRFYVSYFICHQRADGEILKIEFPNPFMPRVSVVKCRFELRYL